MRVLLACGLGLLLLGNAAVGGDAKSDLAKLKGTWLFDKDGKKAEFTFTDKNFTLTFDGAKTFKGTFKIDPAKKPKEMDLTVTEGEKFQGMTAQAIYELDGDTLKWCASPPGQANRPTVFPAKEGDTKDVLYLSLKRVKSK